MAKKPNPTAASRPQPPSQTFTDEEREDLRAYIARRVPELTGVNPTYTTNEKTRRAKGEWMLALYEAQGNRVGAALLAEVIADSYGVPR